jgi:hypothetical protein
LRSERDSRTIAGMRSWVLVVVLACSKQAAPPAEQAEEVGPGVSESAEFVDCGCGCCGDRPEHPEIKCVAPSEIRKLHRERAKQAPARCANVGCQNTGTIYRACDTTKR